MKHKKLLAAVIAMSMSFSTVPFMNDLAADNAITVSAASTEQVNVLPSLKATNKSNAVCYSNTDKAAFQMDGRTYYQGVVLTGKSSITFNVENISKLLISEAKTQFYLRLTFICLNDIIREH